MSEDQLTFLTTDPRSVPDPLRSGAIFEHVQRSSPTFPTMPLRCRSLPLNLRWLPFNSRLFPIGPDFQIGLDRVRSGPALHPPAEVVRQYPSIQKGLGAEIPKIN